MLTMMASMEPRSFLVFVPGPHAQFQLIWTEFALGARIPVRRFCVKNVLVSVGA